jgi:hypothetical protein
VQEISIASSNLAGVFIPAEVGRAKNDYMSLKKALEPVDFGYAIPYNKFVHYSLH